MLHNAICARLPHAGRMCLLERLETWDIESITCIASSHRDPANPLRAHGRLHAVCGVEYAAQAMALHGGLAPFADAIAPDAPAMDGGSAENAGAVFPPLAMGYLASVRDLRLGVARLDDIAEDLRIEARRVGGSAEGFMYSFEIFAGARLLLAGRAMVKLVNSRLPS